MATNNRYTSNKNRLAYQRFCNRDEFIIAFCDTETGGIHAFRREGDEYDAALSNGYSPMEAAAIAGDDLLQFSGIKYRVSGGTMEFLEEIDLFIQNRKPIDPGASKVNHITEERLLEMGAPDESSAFDKIREFLDGIDVFAAYNEPFDGEVLRALYIRHQEEFAPPIEFDVMTMNIDLFSMYKQTSRKLKDVAKFLGCVDGTEEFHNALDDIRATVKVYEKQVPMYDALPPIVDTSMFRTPKIQRHWVWQNPKTYKMVRIYFQTDCGKIFFEKLDRSFGTDGQYALTELNMEGFVKRVCQYFQVDRLEDVVHLKL